MITLNNEVTESEKNRLKAGFARMPQVMDYIRRYEFGFDLGNLGPGGPDFGLVADFDSEEDWRRYSANPDHRELSEIVRRVTAEMTRVQNLVDER
jgi:hypothetical protein